MTDPNELEFLRGEVESIVVAEKFVERDFQPGSH